MTGEGIAIAILIVVVAVLTYRVYELERHMKYIDAWRETDILQRMGLLYKDDKEQWDRYTERLADFYKLYRLNRRNKNASS